MTVPLPKPDMQVKHDLQGVSFSGALLRAGQNGLTTTRTTIPIIASVGSSLTIR